MNPFSSSSSSQLEPAAEEEQQRHEEEEAGNVESYQCGFCRRGFTNAQALGGHMNIHRRDRARISSTSSSSSTNSSSSNKHPLVNVVRPSSSTISYYHPKENHGFLRPNSIFLQGEDIKAPRHYYDYPMYFSPSSSNCSTRPMQNNTLRPEKQQLQQQPLSLFEEEERYTNLQLGIGGNTSAAYIEEGKRQDDDEQEEGIDLELRLGNDSN